MLRLCRNLPVSTRLSRSHAPVLSKARPIRADTSSYAANRWTPLYINALLGFVLLSLPPGAFRILFSEGPIIVVSAGDPRGCHSYTKGLMLLSPF